MLMKRPVDVPEYEKVDIGKCVSKDCSIIKIFLIERCLRKKYAEGKSDRGREKFNSLSLRRRLGTRHIARRSLGS